MESHDAIAGFELAVDDLAVVVSGEPARTEREDSFEIVLASFEVGVHQECDTPLNG